MEDVPDRTSTRKTILVVDDDYSFRAHVRDVLASAGYAVLGARDGPQALQLVSQMEGALDAAVVDLSLPGTSGYEVVGEISRRAPAVRLLATSGVYRDPYLQTAMACGAHAAIPKSANREEWLRTVRDLLDGESNA